MKKIARYFGFVLLLLGCTEVFIEDISEVQVKLLSPGDSIVTTYTSQTFFWEIVNYAEEYEIQVVSPSFDSIEVFNHHEYLAENFKDLTLPPGTYQWRIRAVNGSGPTKYAQRNLEIIEE